jgi:polyhydroxyalkanoate synthesis regulator phasin
MRLNNTTAVQDEILSEAEREGGTAADVAEICQYLDSELTATRSEAESLGERLNQLERKYTNLIHDLEVVLRDTKA